MGETNFLIHAMEAPNKTKIHRKLGQTEANLEEVMEMSAMQKSASSLCTSPSIPFQLPGEDSPPY